MITKIIIKNFQKHVNTEINLGEFNLIIGKSSAGKTSIFRALEFLFYGNWDNTFFNNPKQNSEVTIVIDNNIKITRIRRPLTYDFNIAYIEDPSGKYEFKNFNDVIPLIERVIDVSPIQIGDKEINLNFSKQDSPLFILSESSITKAQWIGRLYGANILDTMLKLANNDKREYNETLKMYKQELNKLEKEYSLLPDYNLFEQKFNKLKENWEKLQKINTLFEKILNYQSKKKEVEKLSKYSKVDFKHTYQTLIKYEIIEKYLKNDEKIKKLQAKLEKFNKVNIKPRVEKIMKIIEIDKRYDEVIQKSNLINTALVDVRQSIEKIKQEYEEKLKALTHCPLCGNQLNKTQKKKVIQNL